MMDIKKIQLSSTSDFEQLAASWKLLNDTAENGCVFLSWDWMFIWWKTYAKREDSLWIQLFYLDEQLIALAPFYRQKSNKQSTLRFLGTGEEELCEVATEYLDILCIRKYQNLVLVSLKELIDENSMTFDQICFDKLLESSLVLKLVNTMEQTYFINRECIGQRYLSRLTQSWPEFLSQLNLKSFPKKLKTSEKRFNKIENSSLQLLTTLEDIKEYFPKLIKLHQERWQKKNKSGAFCCDDFIRFHSQFIQILAAPGKIKLLALEVNHQVIAVFYFIFSHNCCYYYQSGINNYFRPNVSPGFLGHSLMIQYCIDHQIESYDFMMGSINNSYKSKFNPDTEKMFNTILVKKNSSGFLVYLKWQLRKIKHYIFNRKQL